VDTVDLQPAHAAPVINTEVALQRLGGDKTLHAVLLTYFVQDAPGLMQKLREAHQAGTLEVFTQTIHGLKGLAATFEAVPFVTVAREIESASRARDLATVQSLLPQLDFEFGRLFGEIESLARGTSATDSAASNH
jgi:HPt (histidine-containing phosphotransfer) domain-containing protein